MADRMYSKEGLQTARNRDTFANALTRRICFAENRNEDIEARDENELLEKYYDGAIELIEVATTEAFGRDDNNWPADARNIIEFIVPIHSHRKDWLMNKLKTIVLQQWAALSLQAQQLQQRIGIGVMSARVKVESTFESTSDRWNRAIGELSPIAGGSVGKMLSEWGIAVENLEREIERSRRTREELRFGPSTVYTSAMQHHIDDNPWLQRIDAVLKAQKMDQGPRGRFWSVLLLK